MSGYSNTAYDPTTAASGAAGATGDYRLSVELTAPPSAGGEFRANATTAGFQGDPAVAVDAAGGSWVVWAGSGPGDDSGVFAQRYDAAGQPVGGQVLVNQHTTGSQGSPSVGVDAVGAWQSSGQDGSSETRAKI